MEFVYQYDENGSLIRKTSRAEGSYETYTWNHRGKMTSARGYTSGNEFEWEEVYRYDALNRNITTIRNEGGSSETKHSVYDEAGLYSLLYELDGAQRVTMAAMHGPAVDMVLAEDRVDYSSGAAVHELNWLLGDHQNSATVVADGDGTDVPQVKSATVRSAFGNVVSQTGTAVDSAFGFQGQVEDEATGQGVFRNRNYSSQQGRFISQDPIRFASGQTNHYQFVANHPHMGTDPSGLAEGAELLFIPDPRPYQGVGEGYHVYTNDIELATEVANIALSLHLLLQAEKGLAKYEYSDKHYDATGEKSLWFPIGLLDRIAWNREVNDARMRLANLAEVRQSIAKLRNEVANYDLGGLEFYTDDGNLIGTGVEGALSALSTPGAHQRGLESHALQESDFSPIELAFLAGKLGFSAAKQIGRLAFARSAATSLDDVARLTDDLLTPRSGLASEIAGEAIDPARFARMRDAFVRNGGVIDQSADAQAYLRLRQAEGLTFDSKTILLPDRPSTSSVFEEFIHATQHRTGRFNKAVDQFGNARAIDMMEIEAAEKLIRNRRAWGIPNAETRQTIERLRGLRGGSGQ